MLKLLKVLNTDFETGQFPHIKLLFFLALLVHLTLLAKTENSVNEVMGSFVAL